MSDLKEKFETLKIQWHDKRNNFSSSFIEDFVRVRVKIISVGYEREQTIRC